MVKFRKLLVVAILMLGILLPTSVLSGCGEEKATTTATTTTTSTQNAANVIGDRAIKVLAATPTTGEYTANAIAGTELAKKLADPAEKAKFYILDVRKKADFDMAHIEGATQVEVGQWAAPDNLAKLPKDKKIVVVCYTANTAAQAATGMRMLGLDAVVLKNGMSGWAQTGMTQGTIAELSAANNPVVKTPAEASTPAPPGATLDKVADADYKLMAEKLNKLFTTMPAEGEYANNSIAAAKLSEKLANPAEKDKLFLLDVRKKADYESVGHIDGTTQVEFEAAAVPDNLKKLPKDKKIVVICYSGNTAGQVATVLRMLDYDAVVLKYGMMGWTKTPQTDPYITDIQNANNPTVSS